MDSFERAHVKKTESSRRENKSEEAMKKHLKQMLDGYKHSDNRLIMESAAMLNKNEDPSIGLDDSTSVSGFSDLNLTNSSTDADATQGTLITPDDDSINEYKWDLSKESSQSDIQDCAEVMTESIASISEYEYDKQSLPEDIQETTLGSVDISDLSSYLSSTNGESTDSDFDDSESGEFDPDGALASKILENLRKKEMIAESKKGKKRKLEVPQKSNERKKASATKKKNSNIQQNTGNECENAEEIKIFDKDQVFNEKHNIREHSSISDYDIAEKMDTISIKDSVSMDHSSSFISITVTDMQDQSLSEILGEYKYSTVRNLPSEKQNIIYSANHLGPFSAESLDMSNVQIEEETDSLVPELGDEVIEDLEIETGVGTHVQNEDSDEVHDEESQIVYDETIQSEHLSDEEPALEPSEVDYVNPVKVFYGKNTCIFILNHPTELYIHGKVKIKALAGTTEVLGYTLQDESYELYAPNYNYAHCLKTVQSQNSYYGLFGRLTSLGVSVKDAEEIVIALGEYDCVLSLTSMYSRVMEFVENNFTAADLFTKPSKYIENCFKKASQLLGCSLYLTKPWKCFEENSSWEQAVEYGMNNQSRGIVCGGKGTGKSTFLRYYVNRLLANGPVLVIDLDPGQAEFTVAGNVSVTVVTKPLLGPNFTHLTTPERVLNVGMINTMENTVRYTSAVETLLSHCHSNVTYQAMPWIVNTMGMCNNMGLKYITHTILHARPTFLLQIDTRNAKKRFEVDLHPSSIKNLYQNYKYDRVFRNVTCSDELDYAFVMSSNAEIVRSKASLVPRDERYLNFLAYFGELLNVHSGPGLLGIVPYEVKMRDFNIIMNVKVPENLVTKAINGKIVALCQLATQDKGRVFTLGDKAVHCLGHGLIRGVDSEKGVLYIVTPESVKTLSRVDTLLYADWVPEFRGQEKHLPEGTAVPYHTTSVQQQRQLMVSPRRRFNPIQLLKLSRNT